MKYQTYDPHVDLSSIVQCYWTLEVPYSADTERQRVDPDGTIEMAFLLGDDIRRIVSEDEFVLQPRSMVIGQIIAPFYIIPLGSVHTFAIRFYPYGFANLIQMDIKELRDKETPICDLFGEVIAKRLEAGIHAAENTLERIQLIEDFLFENLSSAKTIDRLVANTVNDIIESDGSLSVQDLSSKNKINRRQLERKFAKQVGISPKQMGKVVRLQAALKLLIHQGSDSLTQIAYQSNYYDQAHFNKDFQEFTGTNPTDFLSNKGMELSTLFYSEK